MRERFEGPDFIGIGVQRAGTSWLYQCLIEHPQIYMPRKEMHFFDQQYDQGLDWYSAQFSGAVDDQVRGEYTPDYMASSRTVERIYEYRKDVKLLLILREPLARAHSAFKLFQSHGRFEGKEFSEVIRSDTWILKQSLYYDQLKHLFSLFSPEQVHIELYEDIAVDPGSVFSRTCKFLEIDEKFTPQNLNSIRNSSAFSGVQGKYSLPGFQKLILRSWFGKYIKPLKKAYFFNVMKKYLIRMEKQENIYSKVDLDIKSIIESDIVNVDGLVDFDLSKWRNNYEQ
jgi:hypothetical protein